MAKLPFAEDVNYFKTGRKSPDTLMESAAKMIREHGGDVRRMGMMMVDGRDGAILDFDIAGERFRIAWPVLTSRYDNEPDITARRRQAATFVYHEVKSRCMVAKVFGTRAAFIQHMVLPGSQTSVMYAGNEQLHRATSHLLPESVQ